ncbi:hypothetical protein [Actinomadura madurae]|nr:hypothetical protein [Actinomadura madurae]MCP9949600.1 hypothetical protein [Actinomadura madurae]MCQ0009627.1 hypothetical protein [Actinomadura madurae]
MDVEFALLGPFEMRAGGRNVPMGGPKHRSLLAALLLRAGGRCRWRTWSR